MNKILFFVAGGTAEQYAKPHKPDREEQIPHGLTYEFTEAEERMVVKEVGKKKKKRWGRGGVGRWLWKEGRNMLMLFLILSSIAQHDEYS